MHRFLSVFAGLANASTMTNPYSFGLAPPERSKKKIAPKPPGKDVKNPVSIVHVTHDACRTTAAPNTSHQTALPKNKLSSIANVPQRAFQTTATKILSRQKSLPKLPPIAYFPQYDTRDYDSALSRAVHDLQDETTSGARQLADAALHHLADFSDIAAEIAVGWDEFWTLLVRASKQLSRATPSMGVAMTACLLRTLERIATRWSEEQAKGHWEITKLAEVARSMIDEILQERREVSKQLCESFTLWLKHHCGDEVHILTLSNSSTIRAAVLHALAALPDVTLFLVVLESRPRCEGADMAARIYAEAGDTDRLHIGIMPDCAVGQAVEHVDLVLLGAECISATGDVCNKISSLTAAICAKSARIEVPVVVLSESDTIAAIGLEDAPSEEHPAHELSSAWALETEASLLEEGNVEIFGERFEWVPAELVDAYVTELGILKVEHVARVAQELKELEEYIFGVGKE